MLGQGFAVPPMAWADKSGMPKAGIRAAVCLCQPGRAVGGHQTLLSSKNPHLLGTAYTKHQSSNSRESKTLLFGLPTQIYLVTPRITVVHHVTPTPTLPAPALALVFGFSMEEHTSSLNAVP